MNVLIDLREPEDLRKKLEKLLFMAEIPSSSTMLEIGDFVIEGKKRVAIERKTIHDLLTSVSSGRLQDQIYRLTTDGMDVIILGIEGSMVSDENGYVVDKNNRPSGWKWTNILGILTTVSALGVIIHWVPETQYAEYIFSQVQYWDKDKHSSIRIAPVFPSGNTVYDGKKRVLMSLPGIAEDLAERALSMYSVKEIVDNPDILIKVPGIGKKKVQAVKEILND